MVDARRALDAGRAGDPRRPTPAAPTTTSSTGRRATRPPPRPRSRAPTSSSSRTCSSRARTRRRWRPAARSPTSTAVSGKLTIWCTTQAPHAHRTMYALITGPAGAQDPRDLARRRRRLRQQGAGLSRLRLRDRRLDDRPGSPVKWVEDRSENLMSTGFARDYVMTGRIARDRRGPDPGGRASTCIADHGAFNATAQPSRYPAGFFSVFTGSYDVEAAHCRVTGVYTNKAPGGVAYACSFRIAEAVYLVERVRRLPRARARHRPGRRCGCATCCGPSSSRTRARPAGSTTPATTRRALRKALDDRRLRRAARASRPRSATRGELMGIGVAFFTEAVGAGPRKHMDMIGPGHERRRGAARLADRHGAARDQRADAGPGPRDDVRADRRRGARASRPRTSRSSTATPTPRRTGSAPTGRARRR